MREQLYLASDVQPGRRSEGTGNGGVTEGSRMENGDKPSCTCPCVQDTCSTPTTLETREELRQRLTPMQYKVTQEKGTERPYSNKYYKQKEVGTYSCIVCEQNLFSSDTKYDSGCGWPAFWDVLDKHSITLKTDLSHVSSANLLLLAIKPELARTEVSCSRCGAHLGHVFDDGPTPTGKRYCINSSALNFQAAKHNNHCH